jgi:hypothetical protein
MALIFGALILSLGQSIRRTRSEVGRSSQAVARWYLRISANRARQYSRYNKLMNVNMTEPHLS